MAAGGAESVRTTDANFCMFNDLNAAARRKGTGFRTLQQQDTVDFVLDAAAPEYNWTDTFIDRKLSFIKDRVHALRTALYRVRDLSQLSAGDVACLVRNMQHDPLAQKFFRAAPLADFARNIVIVKHLSASKYLRVFAQRFLTSSEVRARDLTDVRKKREASHELVVKVMAIAAAAARSALEQRGVALRENSLLCATDDPNAECC